VVPTRLRFPEDGPVLVRGDLDIDGKPETRAACAAAGSPPINRIATRSGACRDWRYEAEQPGPPR